MCAHACETDGDITPNSTLGMLFTGGYCLVAIGIGAIPVGILGAGYVEELEDWKRAQEERKKQLRRDELESKEIVVKLEEVKSLLEDANLLALPQDEIATLNSLLASCNQILQGQIVGFEQKAIYIYNPM